jgi:hypothetical protein
VADRRLPQQPGPGDRAIVLHRQRHAAPVTAQAPIVRVYEQLARYTASLRITRPLRAIPSNRIARNAEHVATSGSSSEALSSWLVSPWPFEPSRAADRDGLVEAEHGDERLIDGPHFVCRQLSHTTPEPLDVHRPDLFDEHPSPVSSD